MRITEKQLLALLTIAEESLVIAGNAVFTYAQDQRLNLVNDITRQQSDEIIEIGKLQESPDEPKKD